MAGIGQLQLRMAVGRFMHAAADMPAFASTMDQHAAKVDDLARAMRGQADVPFARTRAATSLFAPEYAPGWQRALRHDAALHRFGTEGSGLSDAARAALAKPLFGPAIDQPVTTTIAAKARALEAVGAELRPIHPYTTRAIVGGGVAAGVAALVAWDMAANG
jgi:hypothetical protein